MVKRGGSFLSMRTTSWLDVKAVKLAVQQASVSPIEKCAAAIEREAKASMKRDMHNPSPEGSPPNVQTNVLRSTIQFSTPTFRGTRLIGPTVEAFYGKFHEYGKRPFMRPALMRVAPRFPQYFRNLPLANTPAGAALAAKLKRKRLT